MDDIDITALLSAPPLIESLATVADLLGRSRQHIYRLANEDDTFPPAVARGARQRSALIEYVLRRNGRHSDIALWTALTDSARSRDTQLPEMTMLKCGVATTPHGPTAYSLHRTTNSIGPHLLVLHDARAYTVTPHTVLAGVTPALFGETPPPFFVTIITRHTWAEDHRRGNALAMLCTAHDLEPRNTVATTSVDPADYGIQAWATWHVSPAALADALGFPLPIISETPAGALNLPSDWTPNRPNRFPDGWTGEQVAFLREANWWWDWCADRDAHLTALTAAGHNATEILTHIAILVAHAATSIEHAATHNSINGAWAGDDLTVPPTGYPELPDDLHSHRWDDDSAIDTVVAAAVSLLTTIKDGTTAAVPFTTIKSPDRDDSATGAYRDQQLGDIFTWLTTYATTLLSHYRIIIDLAQLPAAMRTRLRAAPARSTTIGTLFPGMDHITTSGGLDRPVAPSQPAIETAHPPTALIAYPPDSILVSQYIASTPFTPSRHTPILAEATTSARRGEGSPIDVLVRIYTDGTISLSAPTPPVPLPSGEQT